MVGTGSGGLGRISSFHVVAKKKSGAAFINAEPRLEPEARVALDDRRVA